MEAAINSILSELKETIKNCVEDVLVSVDQWTQGPSKELDVKIEETELVLQTSLDMQTKNLCEEFNTYQRDLTGLTSDEGIYGPKGPPAPL
jgi:hypothetical protein